MRNLGITRRDPVGAGGYDAMDQARSRMGDAHRYLQSRRDPGSKGKTMERVVDAAEVAGGAALVGLLVGRLGHWNIPGPVPLPIGLVIGAAAHAADFYGVAGKFGPHLANVGNGAIASWAAMLGAGYGRQMAAAAGDAGPIVAGCSPAVGCGPSGPPRMLGAPSVAGTAFRPTSMTEAEYAAIGHRCR